MRKERLAKLSTGDLVAHFIEISEKQAIATVEFENARVNRLFWNKVAVVNELRRRPGDERRALLELYMHDNLQVRLNAVQSAYALNPARAEAVLREVAESRREPWAFHARMSLSLLEDGTSQLPNDPVAPER